MADEKFVLNFGDFKPKIKDLVDFEKVAGRSYEDALRPHPLLDEEGEPVLDEEGEPVKQPRLTAFDMHALVWILKRREDPKFTLEKAGDIEVESIDFAASEVADPPSVAAGSLTSS